MLLRMILSVLLWRQIIQGVGRSFLVEEHNVALHFSLHIIISSQVEIIEYLGLDPSVDCFHGSIVGWRSGARH